VTAPEPPLPAITTDYDDAPIAIAEEAYSRQHALKWAAKRPHRATVTITTGGSIIAGKTSTSFPSPTPIPQGNGTIAVPSERSSGTASEEVVSVKCYTDAPAALCEAFALASGVIDADEFIPLKGTFKKPALWVEASADKIFQSDPRNKAQFTVGISTIPHGDKTFSIALPSPIDGGILTRYDGAVADAVKKLQRAKVEASMNSAVATSHHHHSDHHFAHAEGGWAMNEKALAQRKQWEQWALGAERVVSSEIREVMLWAGVVQLMDQSPAMLYEVAVGMKAQADAVAQVAAAAEAAAVAEAEALAVAKAAAEEAGASEATGAAETATDTPTADPTAATIALSKLSLSNSNIATTTIDSAEPPHTDNGSDPRNAHTTAGSTIAVTSKEERSRTAAADHFVRLFPSFLPSIAGGSVPSVQSGPKMTFLLGGELRSDKLRVLDQMIDLVSR
jgi:hypothetical protein